MSSNTWTQEIFQERFSLVNSAPKNFAGSVRPHDAMTHLEETAMKIR